MTDLVDEFSLAVKMAPGAKNILLLGASEETRKYLQGLFPTAEIKTDWRAPISATWDIVLFFGIMDFGGQLRTILSGIKKSPSTVLICGMLNPCYMADICHFICGDAVATNRFSQSALFKVLLDAGWLPTLEAAYVHEEEINSPLFQQLITLATSMRVHEHTAIRNLLARKMVISASAWASALMDNATAVPKLSVIVTTNNPRQYAQNIVTSPGLMEIGAEVIAVRDNINAAEAYERGKAQATGEWLIMCHQDVYFPAGSGHEIVNNLKTIPADTLVGFSGMTKEGVYAGLCIDRVRPFDHPVSDQAITIDEFAVAMHKDSPLRIDPDLGWHCWGTDLCLQKEPAKVIRVPLYHNSYSDPNNRSDFYESGNKLLAKYPHMDKVYNLSHVFIR